MRVRYLVRTLGDEVPVENCSHEPRCMVRPASFATADGQKVDAPQPGDVYLFPLHEPGQCPYWDNCDGRHLMVVLPKPGGTWDVDSRASNCTMRDDRQHRCWVRHGDPTRPETLHVDKQGHTCQAGAGSILSGGFHGYLHNGQIVGA